MPEQHAITQPVRILLVDDDPVDVRLTLEALRDAKIHVEIDVARNGVEAMAFLRREGAFSGAERPDLVLLDLNMPKKSGREVLAEMKADAQLRGIPVVVLTTSGADEDIVRARELGASCYVTKPVDLTQFAKVVRAVEDFWISIVRLPRE
jgi:two-component system, chemotaxis family, response regulator Rcp1